MYRLPMLATDWTAETLAPVGDRFEDAAPEEILRWAFDTFGDRVALATGFGPSGIVLLHLVARLRPETTVCYADTGLLFPETYALRDELAERLGLTFTRLTPAQTVDEQERTHGPELWRRDPDRCCARRKVAPLRRFLAAHDAWITGIRRDQSPQRARIRTVDWDAAHGLVKLCPLAAWTAEDVWAYLLRHDLPTNPLHAAGYPSIGCTPCTRPVPPGADERSGRWAGQVKTECGLHYEPSNTD